MLFLRVCFFLLLALLTLDASAAMSPFGCFDVYVPSFQGGLKFNAGVMYLRGTVFDFDDALTFNTEGFFEFKGVTAAYHNWSYELGLGYDFRCTGNDVRLNYSDLHQDETSTIQRGTTLESTLTDLPFPPIFVDTVSSPGLGPVGTAIGSPLNVIQLDFINSKADFKENKLDLEFGQSIKVTPYLRLRFFGGLRATQLEYEFTSLFGLDRGGLLPIILTGIASDPSFETGLVPFVEFIELSGSTLVFRHEVDQKSRFSGIGPRLGLEADYYLDIGISLFANSSASIIIGDINSTLRERADSALAGTVTRIAFADPDPELILTSSFTVGEFISQETSNERSQSDPNSQRVVPNLEARLGVSYMPYLPCTCSKVYLQAGYMVNHYFNAVDKLTEVSDNNALSTNHTSDLTFDGFYLKVEMRV